MNSTEKEQVTKIFNDVFESLHAESDRGCVLVVGSLVENAIEGQISARLILPTGKTDELMSRSNNSPISTFSAKIDLAYRLGIFPANERKIYHQLRELRNTCAHQVNQQDFDKAHFKDRIKNIIEESNVLWDIMRRKIAPILFPNDPPSSVSELVEAIGWRKSFEWFFSLVVAHKVASIERVTRIYPLYAPRGEE